MSKSLPLSSIFFLLLTLAWLNSYAEDDDDKSHSNKHADFSVYIDSASQLSSGMKIQALHTSQFNPEIETFAVSVDLAPLINIRKDYFLAKSQQQSAHIKLQHSQKNVQRLRALQRDQAVSTRKLHEQQVQLQINQTLFNTAQQQANNIQLYAQLQKS
jgi:hypothetical protein